MLSLKLLKPLPIALLLMCQGCVTSTYVSAIGARTQVAAVCGQDLSTPQRVMVSDYQQGPCVIEGNRLLLPYFTSCTAGSKTDVGLIEVSSAQIEWTAKEPMTFEGKVDLVLPEGPRTFRVDAKNLDSPAEFYYMNLQRRYRRWYSYPAQLLLVITVPVDVVIFTGSVVGAATWWVIEGVTYKVADLILL